MATKKKRFGGIAGGITGLILAKGFVVPFVRQALLPNTRVSDEEANQIALVAGCFIPTVQFACIAFGYLLGDWIQNAKRYTPPPQAGSMTATSNQSQQDDNSDSRNVKG